MGFRNSFDRKDELVNLWRETCKKTTERNRNFYSSHTGLPGSVCKFVEYYFDTEPVRNFLNKDEETSEHKVSFHTYREFLYFEFDSEPPIILRKLDVEYSGKVKVLQNIDYKKRGFWIFKKSVPFYTYKACEEDKKRIIEKYGNDVMFTDTKKAFQEFNVRHKCAFLTFGSLSCLVSPELKKELETAYFDAVERVDLEILKSRVV